MRSIYAVVAVFSLLSGGQSVPVDTCESLTQQLEIQTRDQVRPPSFALLCFFCLFVEFDFTRLRVRLSFPALGQVDCHCRKHRYPRIQTDDNNVRGQQLGESHSLQRKRHHWIFSGSKKVTHCWNGSTHNFLSFHKQFWGLSMHFPSPVWFWLFFFLFYFFTLIHFEKSLGQCFTLKYNMTLNNSTLSIGELHYWTVGKHVETHSSGLCVLHYNSAPSQLWPCVLFVTSQRNH